MVIFFFFFFFFAEFYRVIWTINALLTVRSEMLQFSGNNQKKKMFGVPPNTFPIGYVHTDNLPLGNIALQYMSFKTIAGRSDGVLRWFPALYEDQEKKLSNSPKLSCGFNSLGPEKLVRYIRYFVISDLFVSTVSTVFCFDRTRSCSSSMRWVQGAVSSNPRGLTSTTPSLNWSGYVPSRLPFLRSSCIIHSAA